MAIEKKMQARIRVPLATIAQKMANTDSATGTDAQTFGTWVKIFLPTKPDVTGLFVTEKNPFILIPFIDIQAQFPEIQQAIGKEIESIFVDNADLVFEGKEIDFK